MPCLQQCVGLFFFPNPLTPGHHPRKCFCNTQRNQASKVQISVITDGLSNVDQYQAIQKALLLKKSGAEVFVISMETDVDEAELTSLASDPAQRHVIIQSFLNDPARLVQFAVYGICNLPLPTPAPPSESFK